MAYENGIVGSNSMSRVKRLREPEPRQRYLNQYSDDEEERLMKALAVYGEHVVALAELDLEMGMRLGELLNAKWADVDEIDQCIFIMRTKNDKPRLVPLTARALEILKHVKWLAKFGSKFAVLPSGVRKYEIQQATFLARLLFYGQFVHPPREVEQSDVVLNLVKFGGLVVCDR
jgi:integrase